MKKNEWTQAFERLARSDDRPEWFDVVTWGVANAIATYADYNVSRPVWPSLEEIARTAGCSRQTAQRRVSLLVKQGYLAVVQKGGRNLRTGESWSSRYELTVPGVTALRVVPPPAPQWDVREGDDMALVIKRNPGIDPDTARRLAQ